MGWVKNSSLCGENPAHPLAERTPYHQSLIYRRIRSARTPKPRRDRREGLRSPGQLPPVVGIGADVVVVAVQASRGRVDRGQRVVWLHRLLERDRLRREGKGVGLDLTRGDAILDPGDS
jgi:hypothetical protein